MFLLLLSGCSFVCKISNRLFPTESSEEGLPQTPTSLQPSPVSSGRASVSSQLDSSHPLDYLFLSECETGSVSVSGYVSEVQGVLWCQVGWWHCWRFNRCFRSCPICRHDSFSNSEISLEQKSTDDATKDTVPSPLYTNSSSLFLSHTSPGPGLFLHGSLTNPPFSAPCTSMVLPSSSSSPLHHCATSVFQFDKPFSPASFEERGERQTPPPLPPKPSHPSEQQKDGSDGSCRTIISQTFSSHAALFPRRTSLSSLDRYRIGLLPLSWCDDAATCLLVWPALQGNNNNHFFFQEMLTERQETGGRVLIWWDNQNQRS